MACTRPLDAWKKPGGGITFKLQEGFADRPVRVPCGQCQHCRLKRSRDWALRCMHEFSMSARSCFITLTYRPEAVPEDMGLDVKDWQRFARKTRKALGPFRYFGCGEYGELTQRPHFHALLFGLDFTSKVEELTRLWGMGHVHAGRVTYQSASYVARYCMKKSDKPCYARINPDTGEIWSVPTEFSFMSRRPGIGDAWFKKYARDVFPSDEVVMEGKKFSPPRYYLSKLPEADVEAIKDKRRRNAALHKEDLTGSRLRDKEDVLAIRQSLKPRNKL